MVLFYFWNHGNSPQKESGLAQVIESVNDVRTRQAGAFFFQETRLGDFVESGDTVFTGPDSRALVQFEGLETKIQVQEMSQVRIDIAEKTIRLQLGFGLVEGTIRQGESLVVVGNSGTVEAIGSEPAKVRVHRSAVGRAEYQLLTGQAEIREGTSLVPLEKEKRVIIYENKDLQQARILDEITLVAPENRSVHPFGEILLSGQKNGPGAVEILVASPSGLETLATEKNQNTFYATFRPAESDKRQLFTWWSKDRAIDDQPINETNKSTFYVNPPQVRIVFPADGDRLMPDQARLRYNSQINLGQPSTFSVLRLSGAGNFSQSIDIGSQSEIDLAHLRPGRYTAQIEIQTPRQFKFRSESIAFQILDNPRLTQIEVEKNQIVLSPQLTSQGLKIQAQVKEKNKVSGFEFEITSPQNASGPASFKAKSPGIFKPSLAGDYVIRARALPMDNSTPWPWSQPQKITVIDTPLTLKYIPNPARFVKAPSINHQVFVVEGQIIGGYGSRLQLEVTGAKAVEVSKDSRSFRAMVDQTTDLKIVTPGPQKTFLAKIPVQVLAAPPQPTLPENKSQLVFLRSKGSTLSLEWVDPEKASLFDIEIMLTTANQAKPYRTNKSKLTLKLVPGAYKWRVKRVSEEPQAWSDWFTFENTQKN